MKALFDKLFYFYCFKFGKRHLYYEKIGLKIGKGCRIYTRNFGSEPFLITIGDNVTVTRGVSFITHDGSAWLMRDQKGRRYIYRPIEIGNNVFVGINAIIMPGVKIEDNVIVAPNSVVTKSVPTGSIVAGVPAKIIGTFEDLKDKVLAEYLTHEEFKKLSGTYKERILQVVDNSFKPFLGVKKQPDSVLN